MNLVQRLARLHHVSGAARFEITPEQNTPYAKVKLIYRGKSTTFMSRGGPSLEGILSILLFEAEADMGIFEPETLEAADEKQG